MWFWIGGRTIHRIVRGSWDSLWEALGEGDWGAGEAGAVPGEGGRDDGIVVGAGWRAVAVAAVGQALEGIVGEFGEEDGIVEPV